MEDSVLGWVDPVIREKFLSHPKVVGYISGSRKKIFIEIQQVSQKKSQTCTITQNFGYEAQASRAELLYPILCLSVRLQVRELDLLHRIDECLNYYKENPVQGMQRLYHKRRESRNEQEDDNYMRIDFSCEAYFFTLKDVFVLLRQKGRPLSKNTANFLTVFFLKAYRTVLGMLNTCPRNAFGLSFSLKARDVLIDQFFRPLLRHPFARYPRPNLAFMNIKEERFINPRIRKEIYETMQTLNSFTVPTQPLSSDGYLTSIEIFKPSRQIYKISDELEQVNTRLAKLPSVLQFPDRTILEELRNIMWDLQDISPLAKHEIDRLNRLQTMLKILGDREPAL